MPTVIHKQPKRARDQITIRLDRDVLQNLEHYCLYLESGRDDGVNRRLAVIFRKDTPFAIWLAAQGIAATIVATGVTAQPSSGRAAKDKP